MSYPAARYHEALPCRLVLDEEDDAKLLSTGWAKKPFPPLAPPPPEPTPTEALTAERDDLKQQLADVTVERDTLALELPRLTREMDALRAGMARKAKAKAEPAPAPVPQSAPAPEAAPEPEPKPD